MTVRPGQEQPSLPELSHEDLAEDDIGGVLEYGGEDDGHPV